MTDQAHIRQRVAPFGSTVATAKNVVGVISYTSHGGGPALGALNSCQKAPSRTSRTPVVVQLGDALQLGPRRG